MSPRPTWLAARSTEFRVALLVLRLTLTDTEARKILDDKLNEHATLMRVVARARRETSPTNA